MKAKSIEKAVIYARVSSGALSEHNCLECQIAECLEFCDAKKLTVTNGHFDVGSANASDRAGLDAVYYLLLSEQVDALVVSSLDRLFRTRDDGMELMELLQETNTALHIPNPLPEDIAFLTEVQAMQKAKKRSVRTNHGNGKKNKQVDKAKVIPKRPKKK